MSHRDCHWRPKSRPNIQAGPAVGAMSVDDAAYVEACSGR